MFYILKKEINQLLNSMIAYLVIIVFLTINGLFLWVLPEMNIFQSEFAGLDTFFFLAPWILMFLIPAVSMRTFSEEKKSGTMEFLMTKPLSEWEILLGKYLAVVFLFAIALIPCLFYYLTVFWLGKPMGNIDSASTLGSCLGLFFLGASFASIGIFSSSVTENQIIAFIISLLLCFFTYSIFDMISDLLIETGWDYFIKNIGIASHYESISRGIIDSRDLIYFASVITIFLSSTRLFLIKRIW